MGLAQLITHPHVNGEVPDNIMQLDAIDRSQHQGPIDKHFKPTPDHHDTRTLGVFLGRATSCLEYQTQDVQWHNRVFGDDGQAFEKRCHVVFVRASDGLETRLNYGLFYAVPAAVIKLCL